MFLVVQENRLLVTFILLRKIVNFAKKRSKFLNGTFRFLNTMYNIKINYCRTSVYSPIKKF